MSRLDSVLALARTYDAAEAAFSRAVHGDAIPWEAERAAEEAAWTALRLAVGDNNRMCHLALRIVRDTRLLAYLLGDSP